MQSPSKLYVRSWHYIMIGSKITQKSLTDGQNEQALVKIIEQFDKLAMVTFMQSCRGLCNNCGKYGRKGVISPNEANKQNQYRIPFQQIVTV